MMAATMILSGALETRSLAAQTYTAVVKQSVNLRPTPSSSQPAIRLLLPLEELRVLSLTKTNGYYNVSTDANEEGWVYGPRIEIDESHPGAVVVIAHHLEALGGRSHGRAQPQMRETGETYRRRAYGA